jgi:2-hydroxychromene-2-carboxylate isomerase
MAKLELYFDFLSPYTYLASTQLQAIAERTGSEVTYTPFQILKLMKLVGNRPTTVESANKNRYARADLARWAARYGVPVSPHPKIREFDIAALDCGALVAAELGRAQPYVHGILRAMWGVPVDLTDRAELTRLLDSLGFEGEKLLQTAAEPRYLEQLERNTQHAADRGAFGSPTFYVGSEMFFGNDRLDFVEQALKTS